MSRGNGRFGPPVHALLVGLLLVLACRPLPPPGQTARGGERVRPRDSEPAAVRRPPIDDPAAEEISPEVAAIIDSIRTAVRDSIDGAVRDSARTRARRDSIAQAARRDSVTRVARRDSIAQAERRDSVAAAARRDSVAAAARRDSIAAAAAAAEAARLDSIEAARRDAIESARIDSIASAERDARTGEDPARTAARDSVARALAEGQPVTATDDLEELRKLGPSYIPYDEGPQTIWNTDTQATLTKLLLPVLREHQLPARTRSIFWVLLSRAGEVEEVVLQTGSGNEAFDRAATEFARQLTFIPAIRSNRPVASWVLREISLIMR